MISGMKRLFIFLGLFCSITLQVYADTVYLKDGKSEKGMVVEDYTDRIVFSTIDGEKLILKEKIEKLVYDDPEMNLVNSGDIAFEKGQYELAHKYYMLALEINPELDMAKKKADHAGLLAYKEKETTKRELIEKRAMLESPKAPVFKKTAPEEILKKELGVILTRTGYGDFRVDAMTIKSPFRKAGVKIGDHIVSIWSRLTSYLTLKDMSQFLLAEDQHIIKLTLEKEFKLQRKAGEPVGAKFIMEWEGMVVESVVPGSISDTAGLKKGDLLVAVNNESIRYIKMEGVLKLLNQEEKIGITVHRTVTVFRSG